MKNFKNFVMCITLCLPIISVANETTNEKDIFKSRIDSILAKNINKKDSLLIDSPELYIWNLNTTDFLKGLMFETSIVLDFMSKNSKDKDKLREFNREFQQNTTCFSIIVGNSGGHFDTIYELTLNTPEKKENYKEAYEFLSYQIIPYKMSKDYLDLCRNEKIKANEYYEKNKKK